MRLREAGCVEVTGLDLLPVNGCFVGDMHDMPFTDNYFGMIWASHVLEHALDPVEVGQEISRVIKPGGYLFAAWPTAFKTNWHDRHDHGHPKNLVWWIPGAQLLCQQHTVAGPSEEWAGIYRIEK